MTFHKCAKTAKWQLFPWSVCRLQFQFHLSVLFQVLVTSRYRGGGNSTDTTSSVSYDCDLNGCFTQEKTKKYIYFFQVASQIAQSSEVAITKQKNNFCFCPFIARTCVILIGRARFDSSTFQCSTYCSQARRRDMGRLQRGCDHSPLL